MLASLRLRPTSGRRAGLPLSGKCGQVPPGVSFSSGAGLYLLLF